MSDKESSIEDVRKFGFVECEGHFVNLSEVSSSRDQRNGKTLDMVSVTYIEFSL